MWTIPSLSHSSTTVAPSGVLPLNSIVEVSMVRCSVAPSSQSQPAATSTFQTAASKTSPSSIFGSPARQHSNRPPSQQPQQLRPDCRSRYASQYADAPPPPPRRCVLVSPPRPPPPPPSV
eukprot:SAG22_NODE_947_length_6367_cov_23.437460_10_plen_120_part_00